MSVNVYIIDPGCGCCSYLPVGEYDSIDDVPLGFFGANYDIELDDDDDC
jgi:hypothetical protein